MLNLTAMILRYKGMDIFSRFPVRLNPKQGDIGKGRLEVYHAEMGRYMPACVSNSYLMSADQICNMIGYT